MRILITTDVFPPGGGGSAQSTAALARGLARRGHDVTVLVLERNVQGELRRDWEAVQVIELGVGKSTPGGSQREQRAATFLRKWAPKERFDVAHAQHWLSAKATVEASRDIGWPVVATVRDYWPICVWSTMLSGTERCPGCSYWRRVLCSGRRHPRLWPVAPLLPPMIGRELYDRVRTLRRAAGVIAVSGHVKQSLPVDHCRVIPNLVDLPDIERRSEGEPPKDLPDRFVFFAGKLEPNKAPDQLTPIIHAAGVRVPLVVAGNGSLETGLREEAARSDEEERFIGWIEPDKVLQLMRRAAAVLFPSRWDEPLSRVLLEGLAVGAVLIVEPTGGSNEIVVHEESGLIGRNVEEMGAALARVLTENGLSTRLRQGARQRANEHFSQDVVLPRVEEVYERVSEGERLQG